MVIFVGPGSGSTLPTVRTCFHVLPSSLLMAADDRSHW
jgi:hypothetical protein